MIPCEFNRRAADCSQQIRGISVSAGDFQSTEAVDESQEFSLRDLEIILSERGERFSGDSNGDLVRGSSRPQIGSDVGQEISEAVDIDDDSEEAVRD